MKELGIDIETKSGADLQRTGVYRYCEDPEWEIQLFGYSIDGGPVQQVDLTKGERIPDEILSALQDKEIAKFAHNCAFERVNLSRYTGLPSGKYIDPEGWYDTMIMAAYNGLSQSLEGAGKALRFTEGKLEEGKDLIRLFAVPRKPTKSNPSRWNRPSDFPEEWRQYCRYNKRDVEVEDKLRQVLPMPPESVWREMWENERINDRGVLLDMKLVHQAIELSEICSEELFDEMAALTGLDNPNSPLQLKEWLKERGIVTDTLGKDTVEEMLKGSLPPDVRRVLQLRLQSSKSSIKKFAAMENAVAQDGRAHGMFRYYGAARTGRFSGRLIQLQNLMRNSMPDLDVARTLVRQGQYDSIFMLYDSVPDVLGQLTRTALVPPLGKLFAVADYSAIEARVLAWLSGETWVLDAFREGKDLYCETASRMFHVPVEKHGVNGHLRQMGKTAILACGYSGGVGAIAAFAKGSIPESDMQNIVDSWREANPHTRQLWYDLNTAAMIAVRDHTRTRVKVGQGQKVVFHREKEWLYVELPSGRHLSYFRPRIGENKFQSPTVSFVDGKTNVRIDVYGGSFSENITQGLARDLLCNSIHLLSEAGYRIVAHVHDEAIVEVDAATAEADLHKIETLMSTAPPWAEGLPLAAAGYVCSSYRKD